MSVIKTVNLKKYFGKTKAVDGVTFTIDEGEIFGFLDLTVRVKPLPFGA
jgi:ABC-2 type transport system ATP-binding protein